MRNVNAMFRWAVSTLLVGVLWAGVFSGVASASTLVVFCSTVIGPTELTGAAIICPQFNVGGSTLSDIAIAVNGGINGSISLTNGSSSTQTGSAALTTNFSFGGLSGFTFVNPIFSASYGTGLQTLSAGETRTMTGLADSSVGSLGGNTTTFAPYTGAGTFNILVSTSSFFSAGGTGGSFSAGQSSTANATATVTYTYDTSAVPVPEPTTVTMLGLGLLAIGLKARKLGQ